MNIPLIVNSDIKESDKLLLKSRKAQHVKLVIEEDVTVEGQTNGFEYFEIVPPSIPDINYSDITLNAKFLGQTFDAPILIAGMTGGYPEAEKINNSLAKIASHLNIPLGLGSQRSMITNPKTISTYNVKKLHPDTYLIGNLGLVQFCMNFDISDYFNAQETINADAMAIHINAFQEICQPEGDLNFKGAWSQLEKISKASKVPVIAKEVGAGIAYEDVVQMENIGINAVDVGGGGGTSWAKIELMRHEGKKPFELNDPTLKWGVPTAFATYEATSKSSLEIIATGGMYHGLMAVKALMMGASMIGIARPILIELINHGETAAEQWITNYIESVKRLMFLLGAETVDDLKKMKHRLIPRTRAREWLSFRKII